MDGRDHRYFRRIAALLMALAELAERAGKACPPVRFLVFWILGRAETAARAHAVALAPTPLLLVRLQRFDATPDEASRLANDFRALATVFRMLAHEARLAPGAPRVPVLSPNRPSIKNFLRTIAAFLMRPADTS